MTPKILTHPVLSDALTCLRDQATPSDEFREQLSRASHILATEATRGLTSVTVDVQTPLESMESSVLEPQPVLVPVLRAGLGLLPGFLTLLPQATVAHVGAVRDHETLEASVYLNRLPDTLEGKDTIVLDPMLATGHSSTAVLNAVAQRNPSSITMVVLIAAPEGIEEISNKFPEMQLIVGVLDRELNDVGYILPGLGDAGDRTFNT